jgi:hypothetical protein
MTENIHEMWSEDYATEDFPAGCKNLVKMSTVSDTEKRELLSNKYK